jgi:hypothetical protein
MSSVEIPQPWEGGTLAQIFCILLKYSYVRKSSFIRIFSTSGIPSIIVNANTMVCSLEFSCCG